jgi:hypothetical protein
VTPPSARWQLGFRPPGAWDQALRLPFKVWLDWMQTQVQAYGVCLEDGRPLRFVPHDALPKSMAYEHFIAESATIPSRDNLHDRLNGLIWLQLPRLKARLNAIQALWIGRLSATGPRGAWRDWATLMDENGALMIDPSPGGQLVAALRDRDWCRALLQHRAQWQSGEIVRLMGHALHEKLLTPFEGITAHAWAIGLDGPAPSDWASVDRLAVGQLPLAEETPAIRPPSLMPLPVLGVPGWWAANEDPAFYDNARVFRPPPADRMMATDSGSDDRC